MLEGKTTIVRRNSMELQDPLVLICHHSRVRKS
jgi:hypothetical protein